MARLTNQHLNQLFVELGFERGDVAGRNRVWRHPASGCLLLLPENKAQNAPRPALLVSLKAHLAQQGHLDEEAFDFFVAEGRLPVRPA